MKVLAIGDIHGRTNWKIICAKHLSDVDLIIFIGDYFDAYDRKITPQMEIDNFKEILEFYKLNPKKVRLLIGNHDYHYLDHVKEKYSRYNELHASEINGIFKSELRSDLTVEEHMHYCLHVDGVLYSHAGITNTWFNQTEKNHSHSSTIFLKKHDLDAVRDFIETYSLYHPEVYRFTPDLDNYDNYGDNICQSPIWIRPKSLMQDGFTGAKQVVGHTRLSKEILIQGDFCFIDALDQEKYLIVENGIFKPMTLTR